MSVLFRKSLQAKLIIVISLVVLILFASIGVLVLVRVADNSEEQAVDYMESMSGEYALVAKSIIEGQLKQVFSTANVMSSFESIPPERRRTVAIDYLFALLEKNPDALAVWTLWEPDALDGLDARYVNDSLSGSDGRGIFTPLIYREEDGLALTEPAPDGWAAYGEPFYTGAKESLREHVTEPYFYPVDGVDVLMISLVAPIIRDGEFLGVLGMDILPDQLQQRLGELKLYESGFGRLIAHSGTVVTHPYVERIGETAPEWKNPPPEIEPVIQNNEINTFRSVSLATGQESMKTFVPVFFGESVDPWYFGTVVPPDEVYRFTTTTIQTYVISMGLGVLVIILVLWLLVRSFLKPLKKAADALADVAQGEGDLTRLLTVSSQDEVGQLSRHFNTFITSLSGIIASIKGVLWNLKNSGESLSANMEQTGAAVYQINTNIESVKEQIINQSAGVTEVSSTIEEIVRNVESLNGLISRQGRSLEDSAASTEEMVANIQSVTRNVESNLEEVFKLHSESEKGYGQLQEVTEVIRSVADQSEGLLEANKVIQGISAQTNLLAMNAAIEAAHAGDAGRGFAVVADEIRKLAESSASQTKNISQVLGALKKLIDSVVNQILDAGRSFEVVRHSVQSVTQRQEQIKSSMEEQSAGSSQVLGNLEELRNITSEVQTGSNEMTSGSQAILKEMQHLMRITQEIQGSMEEMTRGTEEINSAVASVVNLTQDNARGIAEMEQEVGKFTIQE
jgi:methyl-accepting chemotaxis protein